MSVYSYMPQLPGAPDVNPPRRSFAPANTSWIIRARGNFPVIRPAAFPRRKSKKNRVSCCDSPFAVHSPASRTDCGYGRIRGCLSHHTLPAVSNNARRGNGTILSPKHRSTVQAIPTRKTKDRSRASLSRSKRTIISTRATQAYRTIRTLVPCEVNSSELQ